MLQYALVSVCDRVVCLVDDDGTKIVGRELLQPCGPLQALHAAHYYTAPAVQTGLFCFFHSRRQPRAPFDFIRGLFQQFAAMREDQDAAPAAHLVLRHRCKYDGLARAGGQHQQCAAPSIVPLGMDRLAGRLLIGPHLQRAHQKLPWVQP